MSGLSLPCTIEQKLADPHRQQAHHDTCHGVYWKNNRTGMSAPCRCPRHQVEQAKPRNGATLKEG